MAQELQALWSAAELRGATLAKHDRLLLLDSGTPYANLTLLKKIMGTPGSVRQRLEKLNVPVSSIRCLRKKKGSDTLEEFDESKLDGKSWAVFVKMTEVAKQIEHIQAICDSYMVEADPVAIQEIYGVDEDQEPSNLREAWDKMDSGMTTTEVDGKGGDDANRLYSRKLKEHNRKIERLIQEMEANPNDKGIKLRLLLEIDYRDAVTRLIQTRYDGLYRSIKRKLA